MPVLKFKVFAGIPEYTRYEFVAAEPVQNVNVNSFYSTEDDSIKFNVTWERRAGEYVYKYFESSISFVVVQKNSSNQRNVFLYGVRQFEYKSPDLFILYYFHYDNGNSYRLADAYGGAQKDS